MYIKQLDGLISRLYNTCIYWILKEVGNMTETIKKFFCFLITSICIAYIINYNPVIGNAATTDWYFGCHYPTKSIKLRYYASYNSTYTTGIQQSLNSWNGYTSVNFAITNNSSNYIRAEYLSATGSYGVCYCSCSGNEITSFNITLNSNRISSEATNFNHFLRSVTVHELGHVLGLKDNPPVTNSIMRYDRDRNSMVHPSPYDVTNVSSLYGYGNGYK